MSEKRKRKAGITAYNYNSICDIYGCSNMARVSLGIKDYGPGTKYNICNECLEDIVSAAPISIVIVREDVQKLIEAQIAEATELFISTNADFKLEPEIIVPETPSEFYGVGLIEPLIALSDKPEDIPSSKDDADEIALIKAMAWKDLRTFAKELKVEGYGSMKRDDLEAAMLLKLKSGDA